MNRKYSAFIVAAAVAAAGWSASSSAGGRPNDPKPGAHNPEMGQQQEGDTQREQVKMQPRGQQQGSQAKQQQKQQKGKGGAPVLFGVIVTVPLPVTDVALPSGADYDLTIDNGDEMRATLASATEAALSKQSHDDLVGTFVDMDRNRLADFDERALTTLEGRVDQINTAWQEKYGQPFAIAENAVYRPLTFAEGEITDASQFIERWPVATGASGQAKRQSKTITERVRTQGNIEAGREFGVARFPAEHGLPAVNVSFIDEAFGWKIDLPDQVDGRQLRTNLLEHLTAFGERSDQWPVSVLEAQRLASHHVAMALYGQPVPQQLSMR